MAGFVDDPELLRQPFEPKKFKNPVDANPHIFGTSKDYF